MSELDRLRKEKDAIMKKITSSLDKIDVDSIELIVKKGDRDTV